jgi:predicted nucleic acid-binding protein
VIRTALDTSVVIAALLTWHDDHERCMAAMAASSGPGRRLVLPLPALVQSFSVMTRLPPGRRLPAQGALDLLHGSLADRADLATPPAGDGWQVLKEGVAAGAVGGGIHDFEILDVAARAGATRLLTLNPDDFLRFGDRGVEIVVP